MSSNNEARKSTFKKGIDREDARKKREDKGVELRKNKREEGLLKRRALHDQSAHALDAEPATAADGTPTKSRYPTRDEVPALVQGCYVEATALDSVTGLRKLLSLEVNPPIDAVIASGVIPHLVKLLTVDSHPRLEFEAAWCLTNVASGSSEQTAHVVDAGGVAAFTRLLSSPDENTREQAIWALGNIAGDSAALRDAVLQAGALAPLLQQIQMGPKVSLLRNAVWVLSNLCRGRPPPALEQVRQRRPPSAPSCATTTARTAILTRIAPLLLPSRPAAQVGPAIPVLAGLLASCSDEECLADALWGISYLTDGDEARIAAVLASGVAMRLVACLTHTSSKLKVPALRAIGNIVTGSDEQTQQIVNAGALPILGQLVTAGAKVQERKEACWAISNVAAGTPQQLAAVLQSGVLLPVSRALLHAEAEVKKEACWVVCNAVHGSASSPQQVLLIAEHYGIVEPMCAMLQANDPRMVTITLDFIDELCKAGAAVAADKGEGENRAVIWLDEAGGIDKLEELQEHKNEDIYRKAVHILETFLGDSDEEDAALAAPGTCAGGGFQFGLQPQQQGMLSHPIQAALPTAFTF